MTQHSDGDTSTIRKAITEKTPVVIPLGAVIAGIITGLGLAGAWAIWMTNSIIDIKVCVAEVRAAITGHEKTAQRKDTTHDVAMGP